MIDPQFPDEPPRLGWSFVIALSLIAWAILLSPAIVLILMRT